MVFAVKHAFPASQPNAAIVCGHQEPQGFHALRHRDLLPGLACILRNGNKLVTGRIDHISARCDSQEIRMAQHRTALPGCPLVGTGVDATGRRRGPDGTVQIKPCDTTLQSRCWQLHRLGYLHFFLVLDDGGLFLLGIDDISAEVPAARAEAENTVASAREDDAVRGLLQSEHIAAIESNAALVPGVATILGDEDAAIGLVVEYSSVDGVWIASVNQQRLNLALREAVVGRDKGG